MLHVFTSCSILFYRNIAALDGVPIWDIYNRNAKKKREFLLTLPDKWEFVDYFCVEIYYGDKNEFMIHIAILNKLSANATDKKHNKSIWTALNDIPDDRYKAKWESMRAKQIPAEQRWIHILQLKSNSNIHQEYGDL